MSEFEIYLNTGKIVRVKAKTKSSASQAALELGFMKRDDFFDILDIVEVTGNVKVDAIPNKENTLSLIHI